MQVIRGVLAMGKQWGSGLWPVIFLFVYCACNSDQQFTSKNDRAQDGNNGNGPETRTKNKDQKESPTEDASVLPNESCGAAGVTRVRLLSPEVASGAPDNHFTYEISAVDCEGNPLPSLEGTLDFDIGAVTTTLAQGLPYRTFDTDNPQTGTLGRIQGRDLFGNTGDRYEFFRTNSAVKLNLESKSVKIRIDLGGTFIEAYTPEDKNKGTVATYLKFGLSAAVKQSVRVVQAK